MLSWTGFVSQYNTELCVIWIYVEQLFNLYNIVTNDTCILHHDSAVENCSPAAGCQMMPSRIHSLTPVASMLTLLMGEREFTESCQGLRSYRQCWQLDLVVKLILA